jgi:hypothetical protein
VTTAIPNVAHNIPNIRNTVESEVSLPKGMTFFTSPTLTDSTGFGVGVVLWATTRGVLYANKVVISRINSTRLYIQLRYQGQTELRGKNRTKSITYCIKGSKFKSSKPRLTGQQAVYVEAASPV